MYDFDKQEKRIAKVFDHDNPPAADNDTVRTYLDHLKQNLQLPCRVTGSEDFEWEEYYVIGPGSKEDYERLKKSKASYTDTFDIISFDDRIGVDGNYGILVNVIRKSDRKKFVLSLSDLEVIEKDSENYQLLNDFSIWFTNHR